jgi:hypothetical protein
MEAAVTVEQDKQQAASDRNGPSFGHRDARSNRRAV